MRILIITRYFPPYPSIASQRPLSWAKYWSQMGHEVSVLTWDGGESRRYKQAFGNEEVEIINVRNEVYAFLQTLTADIVSVTEPLKESDGTHGKSSLLNSIIRWIAERQHDCRMPHIHDFWKKYAFRAVREETWDLVVSTYAPPVAHAIGYAIKKAGATRFWIADYRDLWLEHTIAQGIFPFTLWERYLEARYVSRADLLTIVSEPLAKMLRHKYPHASVEVITNGFDRGELEALSPQRIYTDEMVRLVYTGSIYPGKRDPTPLFAAVGRLASDARLKSLLDGFEIIFAGSSRENVEKMAREYGVLSWVRHMGVVPREEALRMQRDAHVLIFLEWGGCEIDGILTGKLFEYLCSGTEIWAVGIKPDSAAGQLISSSGAGLVLGDNIDAVVNALKSLLSTRQKKVTSIDAKLLELYDRKLIAECMIEYANVGLNSLE